MIHDLDCTTSKDLNAVVVNKGQFYTLLSRVENRGEVKLLNINLFH